MNSVQACVSSLSDPSEHTSLVQQYLLYRSELHDKVTQASVARKEQEAAKYNKGVRLTVFAPGDAWSSQDCRKFLKDDPALKQKFEYPSFYQNNSILELRRRVADIRHLHLSPEERYKGLSTVTTPNLHFLICLLSNWRRSRIVSCQFSGASSTRKMDSGHTTLLIDTMAEKTNTSFTGQS